jgi:hypothetical protein
MDAYGAYGSDIGEVSAAVEELRRNMDALGSELNGLGESISEGAASWDAYRQAVGQVQSGASEAKASFAQLDSSARSWGKSLSSAIAGAVTTGKLDFSSLTKSILKGLIEIQVQSLLTKNSLGSVFSSLFGGAAGSDGSGSAGILARIFGTGGSSAASVYHGGGVAGSGGAPKRIAPSWLFASARRLHSGLAADEFPAILQAGEEVVSRSDRRTILDRLDRAQGSGGNVKINLVNSTGVQASARKSDAPRWDGKQWVQDIVLEAVNGGNSSLMYAIRNLKG